MVQGHPKTLLSRRWSTAAPRLGSKSHTKRNPDVAAFKNIH